MYIKGSVAKQTKLNKWGLLSTSPVSTEVGDLMGFFIGPMKAGTGFMGTVWEG